MSSSFNLEQHPALRRQSSKGGSRNTNLPIKDINIETNKILPAPSSQIMSNTATTTDNDGSLQLTNDELQLTSSRTLTTNEKAHLRSIFEEQLTITSNSNGDDIDDAIDLIDYGIDMVDRGKNVESVMQELEFMQYDICNSITAKKIGKALSTFLTNFKNGKVLSSTTPSSSLSRPIKHPSSLSKMIESKKDKAFKRSSSNGSHISEITSDAISVISKSSRSGRMIYDKDGKLVKQWAGVKDKLGDSVNSMDDEAYDARMHTYYQELEDEKLRKELTIRQGEARKEIALRKKQQQSEDEESIASKKMDLSTQGTLMKKEDELEQIQKIVNDSDIKQKMYNEDGQLLDTWEKNKCRGGDSDDVSSSENDNMNESSNVEDKVEEGTSEATEEGADKEKRERMWTPLIPSPRSNRKKKKKDVDLSTRGNLKKKDAEIEALRARRDSTKPNRLKQKMYDADGNLLAWESYSRSGSVGSARSGSMDLSAQGNLSAKEAELEALRATGSERRGAKAQNYDEDGNLIAQWDSLSKSMNDVHDVHDAQEYQEEEEEEEDEDAIKGFTSNEVEQLRMQEYQEVMRDRSLSRDEKSRKIEEIRIKYGGAPAFVSDDDGTKDDGSLQLGASDAASKHHAELEFLRGRMKRGSIMTATTQRKAMYNDEGEIVGYSQNEGEQLSHNPGMDLSAQGLLRKKSRELDLIRSRRESTKALGLKKKMYDEDDNLILSQSEEIKKSEEWVCETSAEGMKLKKARELAALSARRESIKPQSLRQKMYDEEGNLMAWKNNVVERDNHCADIDTSAEGMKSKLQREIEALRAGTPNNIDHREVVAPRELTPDETSRLRVQLKSKLNITNPSQEEDASDLLDYAIGMVSDIGQTVGYLTNELLFMEMEVFTSDVADSFGQCLAAFLIDIGGGVTTLTLVGVAATSHNNAADAIIHRMI